MSERLSLKEPMRGESGLVGGPPGGFRAYHAHCRPCGQADGS